MTIAIDVRGPYPVYIKGQTGIKLPHTTPRDISAEAAEAIVENRRFEA